MPPTPEPSAAAALLETLRALPVEVADATCVVRDVPLASYPGGRRPSGLVTLRGAGRSGSGEHVAWTRADHERLRDALPDLVPCGRWRLGAWADELAERAAGPYARAALEAGAIDLALRQQRTNLFRLTGRAPRAVRYVISFDRRADPAAEARRLARVAPGVALKVDADEDWDEREYAALAATGSIAVLDFKLSGGVADHVRAHAAMPDALLEDPALDAAPWTAAVRARVSFDAPVRRAADVARLPVRPAAINAKPARMGGVLEVLRLVAACADDGIAVYFGGMWEVDIGRRQLLDLASLFAPDTPNDIAPLDDAIARHALALVGTDEPGFGTAVRHQPDAPD